jgi:hypothetical protein
MQLTTINRSIPAPTSTGPQVTGRQLATALGLWICLAIGVALALWGTLSGPFNALGWIAVALNLGLGAGFAWLLYSRPRTTSATPT